MSTMKGHVITATRYHANGHGARYTLYGGQNDPLVSVWSATMSLAELQRATERALRPHVAPDAGGDSGERP